MGPLEIFLRHTVTRSAKKKLRDPQSEHVDGILTL